MATKLSPFAGVIAGFVPAALQIVSLMLEKAKVSAESRKQFLDASEAISKDLGGAAKLKTKYDAQRARILAQIEAEKPKPGG